jgi:hypothetical protein
LLADYPDYAASAVYKLKFSLVGVPAKYSGGLCAKQPQFNLSI